MKRQIFTVCIDLGNDAMQRPEDVARALEDVAANLRDRDGWLVSNTRPRDEGSIRDANGNRVGNWAFVG